MKNAINAALSGGLGVGGVALLTAGTSIASIATGGVFLAVMIPIAYKFIQEVKNSKIEAANEYIELVMNKRAELKDKML